LRREADFTILRLHFAGAALLSMRIIIWLRNFSLQWRHWYLLLLAIFWFVWRFAEMALPRLENTRMGGGLHPLEVFWLMRALDWVWLPPFAYALLYALSFVIRPLNTAEAILGFALWSIAILAFLLALALIMISFNF
jgi:hypothetical protein